MLSTVVKRTMRRLGLDLRRHNPATSESVQFMRMLSGHGINLVLDIGANAGQFGESLRDNGYRGRIVSFEPLSKAREHLLEVSRNDSLWEVAPRAAIGREDGEIEIHVAANSASSSVLDMLEAHATAAPQSRYIGSETVPLRRLDAIALNYLHPDSVAFLKIDTQGYEDRVLLGATELLRQMAGVQLELSLVPLYRGQALYDEMIHCLKSNGFELWAIWQSFIDQQNGRLLQADVTFFRNRSLLESMKAV